MMLKSNIIPQNGSIVGHGLPCDFMDQSVEMEHETWNAVSDDCVREENISNNEAKESDGDEFMEIRTAHWAVVEEEPEESTNGFTEKGDNTVDGGTKVVEATLRIDPIPTKTKENDLEWKIVPSTTVVSTVQHSRKIHIPRSISLTEKELREAQSLSDNNSSQLNPTGSCSRGAQLFHRRRQKLKAFEEQKLARQAQIQATKNPQYNQIQYGARLSESMREESHFGSGQPRRFSNMEENSVDHGSIGETDDVWLDEIKEADYLPIDKRAPSPSASEENPKEPLSAYLKETLVVTNSSTNGLIIENSQETETPVKKEQNGTSNTQYCEVHLTLSKPVSVANRTAKPFGGQLPVKRNVSSLEKSPTIDLPPPPTYAETLSSPPPVSRVRSPPSYSALYPSEPHHVIPVQQVINHGERRLTSQPKSGILESISARKAPRKSMFTFIEKPKMAPNPELLSMVQNSDGRQKNKERGSVSTEDESFALGAEASNYQNTKSPNATHNTESSDVVPDWSSGLKSPGVKAKPPPIPIHQALTEDKGKGAELFARRQSRMERFVIQSPDTVRSPSPTMSLPPSWKYAMNARTPPSPLGYLPKNNQRSPMLPSTTQISNPASESVQSQKELEISKRQPYQLQSSLFILSPSKGPLSSLPKGAPPPKPMVIESYRLTRQSSCPSSPLVPSPTVYSPPYFQSLRSPSSVMSPPPVADTPTNFGRITPTNQVSPLSPVNFSNTRVSSPRNKTVIQAPRPSFSAKNAGLESQRYKEFVPGTNSNRVLQHRGSLDGWGTSSLLSYDESSVIQSPPPRSMSPAWSDRSPSPSPVRMENEIKGGKQLKSLLARNIINAAKRKNSSSCGLTSPQSPIHITSPWSPPIRNGSSLPATPRARRSPTGSDISMESEDSGAKSPGFRSYPFSPKGWYGSIREKRDSLPSSSPFTYTP
ncbi:PREDICTED: synaptopodin [Nanorana parkeri]|uniref:synaptopodin n=1 Tax=Nanorana parkeri TaxID=125878 RepID=UPI0008542847|nr:PREDICTED: synaptopodin [Nanorana parkeri]